MYTLTGWRLILAIALLFVAAGISRPPVAHATGKGDTVRLQLKWVTQAQFAGYYAAQAWGFYAAEGLNVEILPGGPEILPEDVVHEGRAEFGVDWLPSLLVQREKGQNLVNIAQIFRRSAVAQVVWRDSGITTLGELQGRRVAVWCCGNQYELYAALHTYGIDPENRSDITIVDQPFDMELFLRREVDAAAATTYNELAQVLETVNPATGRLYSLDDLTVFSMEDEGVGMLEDGIFARAEWLAQPYNQDIAVRFLRASFRGWIYCRDHPDACVDATQALGPALGRGHQRWMMNEVNALIWPAPSGVGVMDGAAFDRTAEIALRFRVIAAPPDAGTYRTDLAIQALAGIREDDRGLLWRKPVVEVTPGGR
jgi:NitT/TauT family transport system substrate-binding protein